MEKLHDFLLLAPVLLFSMVAHEVAHGWAALWQGDPTARQAGRLTWNPIPHIDPFLTILLPLVMWASHGPIFGGAKPVPVDPRNYRHPRRGDIIVSLAGIATNLLLAVVCTALIVPLGLIGREAPAAESTLAVLQAMMLMGLQVNLLLAVFNLLPIPPLDGSHVLKHLLPPRLALMYVRLGRYGMLILFALLAFGTPVLRLWMQPVNLGTNAALRAVYTYIIPSPWTT